MTSPNGLVCFTNCLLPLEDGSLVQKDLWVDERRGVILDAQVCSLFLILIDVLITLFCVAYFLCQKGKARQGHRSRRKHPEVYPNDRMRYIFTLKLFPRYSPGLLDIQINGAYGFDFSVFEGDAEAYSQGLKTVAEKIVETGVTSSVLFISFP